MWSTDSVDGHVRQKEQARRVDGVGIHTRHGTPAEEPDEGGAGSAAQSKSGTHFV